MDPKSRLPKAFHIKSTFPLFSVLTMDDLLNAFDNIKIDPCIENEPEMCLENVARRIKNPLPHVTINQLISVMSQKITKSMSAFGVNNQDFSILLSVDSLYRH